MTDLLFHPVLPFMVAAAMVPAAGPLGRRLLSLAAPVASLGLLLSLAYGTQISVRVIGQNWMLLRIDGLAYIFALAFILYAFIAAVYAWEDSGPVPKAASLGLCGAGVGVVLAGDLLSLFLFWEWLTITSLFLIWGGNTPGAWAAGTRYLMLHLFGAVMLLIGILARLADGEAAFTAMALTHWSSWLILAGMLTNAAVPPLHAWLSDAYPRASVFGTVFLAAFTTKAAVYALARGFAGVELLVWAGTLMALFGVVYAVLENDIRRLLAYHVISQVGYMVAGVGVGTALALNGTAAHAFSHIFYKGLLMMAAGAVIYATSRGKLTELGCLGRPLRWVLVLMMVGAFSISGVPFFNGFVSKSMVVSAAAYSDRGGIELLLLVASMGTFLHTGLKLPWFTFFGTDQGARVVRPVPASMYAAMGLAAAVCVVTGMFPGATLYAVLPFDAVYQPFTAHHFVEALQLLIGTALGFWLLRAKLGGEPTITRDIDVLYRQPLSLVMSGAAATIEVVGRGVGHLTAVAVDGAWIRLHAIGARVSTPPFSVQSAITISTIAGGAWLFLWLLR
jgi:multicomponent Na+:H+ antiporter subunit D